MSDKTPHVIEAVGSATKGREPVTADAIEAAMAQAVRDCYAKGITDPAVIRDAQIVARDRIVNR